MPKVKTLKDVTNRFTDDQLRAAMDLECMLVPLSPAYPSRDYCLDITHAMAFRLYTSQGGKGQYFKWLKDRILELCEFELADEMLKISPMQAGQSFKYGLRGTMLGPIHLLVMLGLADGAVQASRS